MPLLKFPSFVGGTDETQSWTFSQQLSMNLYEERAEVPGSSSGSYLSVIPGVHELVDLGAGPGRAHYAVDNREFAVAGTTLWEIGQFGSATNRGTVAADANPATICSSGDAGGQLFVTSGDNGYILDLTSNVFTLVRTGATTQGDYLDGYFLAFDAATSTMFISDLLDGTTWDPTQFAQRSIAPDPWVSMKVSNRLIYLLGEQTSEVWWNAGTFPFPFEPHPSGFMLAGCAATFSAEVAQNSCVWLGATANGSGMVYAASGFTPENIATFAIQHAINGYSTVSDAVGDTYTWKGHTFYVLTFPTGDATLSYDFNEQKWHSEGTWISEDQEFIARRAYLHAYCFNQHRMLDFSTGSVWIMDDQYRVDVDDRELRWLRRAPALVDKDRLLYFSSFQVMCDVGVGLTAGPSGSPVQGEDPMMMMRCSNDFGKTWGNELERPMGPIGEYGTRVVWWRCGSGRRRVFEVSGTDPVAVRLTDAYLDIANLQAQAS